MRASYGTSSVPYFIWRGAFGTGQTSTSPDAYPTSGGLLNMRRSMCMTTPLRKRRISSYSGIWSFTMVRDCTRLWTIAHRRKSISQYSHLWHRTHNQSRQEQEERSLYAGQSCERGHLVGRQLIIMTEGKSDDDLSF